jgi:REP element-mobilizing transposase RayT
MHANPEHLHILVSRSPSFSEEQPATNISDSSERFINENKLVNGRFNWQDTASAFSVSKADVDKICSYILNQPKHNQKVNYKEEYDEFIRFYQVTLLKNKKA